MTSAMEEDSTMTAEDYMQSQPIEAGAGYQLADRAKAVNVYPVAEAAAEPAEMLHPLADAADAADEPATADSGGRWREVQALFVDDPRGSVELAAGMAADTIESLIASARGRQESLGSSWQEQEAGTEELRTALQGYRTLCLSVAELPAMPDEHGHASG